jgi:hypothetical protein
MIPEQSEITKDLSLEAVLLDLEKLEQGIPVFLAPSKDSGKLSDLGSRMEALRNILDRLKDLKTTMEKAYDKFVSYTMPQAMETEGIKSFKLPSGKGIRVQDETYVSMLVDNFPQMKTWLQDHGEDGIIKETIHPSTLKSFIIGKVGAGEEYPSDLVNIQIIPKARFY